MNDIGYLILSAAYGYKKLSSGDLAIIIVVSFVLIFIVFPIFVYKLLKSDISKHKSDENNTYNETHSQIPNVILNPTVENLNNNSNYLNESENWLDFEERNRAEIKNRVDKFEQPKQLAKSETDIDKKIKLLEEAIEEFETQKNWFYKSKGGKEYFKMYYENLFNSKRPKFDWMDPEQEELERLKTNRDIVIPKILELASSSEGVLQNNIYSEFDVKKSEVQKMIRYLEEHGKINRIKKSGSYLITIKQ